MAPLDLRRETNIQVPLRRGARTHWWGSGAFQSCTLLVAHLAVTTLYVNPLTDNSLESKTAGIDAVWRKMLWRKSLPARRRLGAGRKNTRSAKDRSSIEQG